MNLLSGPSPMPAEMEEAQLEVMAVVVLLNAVNQRFYPNSRARKGWRQTVSQIRH